MPRVSIVIPAFNSGCFLEMAIASVLEQTFTDWECIVVDDGSSEDLSRFGSIDSRVRVIRQEGAGVSMARNRGIADSAGEFIAFLDHDDAFLPTKLENQVKAMSGNKNIGLCHTHFAVIDESGKLDGQQPVPPGNDFIAMLQFGVPFPTNTMVRKSALQLVGIFDPFLTPSEDQDLFLRIAKFFEVVYIPSCEALYRVHDRNTSKNYMSCFLTMENLSRRHQIFAGLRNDKAAKLAAKGMMEYRRINVFGPQAYDAARLAFRKRQPIAFGVHMSRALRWSTKFAVLSIVGYVMSPVLGNHRRNG